MAGPIRGLLGMDMPDDEWRYMMMNAGAGLLGGDDWRQGLSQAVLGGFGGLERARKNKLERAQLERQNKLGDLTYESGLLDLTQKKKALDDQQNIQNLIRQAKGIPSPQQSPYEDDRQRIMPPQNMPMMGPPQQMPSNMPGQRPMPQKIDRAGEMFGLADMLEQNGYVDQAAKYRDAATKLIPESQGIETVMRNGKPVLMTRFKDGSVREVEGFQPKPEMVEANLGDRLMFVDKLNVPAGTTLAKGQSPDSKASNAVAWANYGLSQKRFANELQRQALDDQKGSFHVIGEAPMMVSRGGVARPVLDDKGMPIQSAKQPPAEFMKNLSGLEALKRSVSNYQQMLNDYGRTSYFSPEEIAKLRSAYTETAMGLKDAFELGALTGPDVQVLGGMLTDPSSFAGAGKTLVSPDIIKNQANDAAKFLGRKEESLRQAYKQPSFGKQEQKQEEKKPKNSGRIQMQELPNMEEEARRRGILK